MCSKILHRYSWRAIFGFALFSVSLSSCSYFLDNKEGTNTNSYDLSLNEKSGLNCVEDNTPLLKDYFDMKRDDAKIAEDLMSMKKCLKDALNTFIKHTNGGQEGGGYSPGEIHRFLTSSFDQYTFAVDFLVEAMNLKHSLIGGSKEVVSKAELTTLIVYLDFVYDRLAFHAADRHLLFNSAPGLKRDKYNEAALRLQNSLKGFEKLPRKSEGDFDYASLVRLIPFFVDGQQLTKHWSDTFTVVNSFQALLSSGRKDFIDIKKLPFVVNNLAQIYTAYMEFEKFLKEPRADKGDKDDGVSPFFKDISAVFTFPGLLNVLIKNPNSFTSENLEATHHIQNSILAVFKNAVVAAPESKLSQAYVTDLISTFGSLGLLPSSIHADTLNGMIPLFFGRWLSSASCEGNCASDVVTVENIDMISQIAAEWKERQVWVNSLAPADLRKNIVVPKVSGSENLESFRDVFSRMNHLHWRDYLMIGTNELTYKDMVIFNDIYTLVTIFTRPFNNNRSRAKVIDYYMTQDQTQALFEWFRELGVELRIVDPRSVKSGNTAFVEINLFGSTAYDPEKLNFTEMLEYMEISISTGLRSVHWLEHEFADCQIPGKVDVFNLMRLDPACFRPMFKENIEPFLFSYFPHMVDYLKNDPKANLETVLFYMEKASRQGLIVDNPFDTDSFRLMSSISQYAESMFMRFDKNRDNIIKGEEFEQVIAHVAPNIRKLIVDSLRDDSDPTNPNGLSNTLYTYFPEFEKNLVTYMVKNKAMPAILTAEIKAGQFYGAAELGAFKTWSDNMPSWLGNGDAEARREDFLLVVSGLSYFQRVQRLSRLKKVLWDNDFSFDAGITDPNDKIFDAIADELACSSKIKPDVYKWLFENQKVYWVKEEKDVWVNLWGFKINGSSFGVTQNIYNWTDAVTEVLIQSLMNEPNLGPFCNMPYLPGVVAIREDQSPFRDQRVCSTRYKCVTKRVYQPY
jgi:hypothetical protein